MVDTGDLKSPPLIAGAGSTPVPSNNLAMPGFFLLGKEANSLAYFRSRSEGCLQPNRLSGHLRGLLLKSKFERKASQ